MLLPRASLREYVSMNLKFEQTGLQAIVYDGDLVEQPDFQWFDPEYWLANHAVRGMQSGRGNTLTIETPVGPAVLRNYLRGGWAAHLSRDRYIYTGFSRSRPFREMQLLARLRDMRLPVPLPLAAACRRHGLTYSGALLTRQIDGATTLADRLGDIQGERSGWIAVGQCIRRFHLAGIAHPDLNARNILLSSHAGDSGQVHLVDFDRGSLSPAGRRHCLANLRRLRRSLEKLWPEPQLNGLEGCWLELINGYNEYSDGGKSDGLA